MRTTRKLPDVTDVDWLSIIGANLTPGVILFKHPTGKKEDLDVIKLPAITGRCSKGIHFGNACYDRISTWWVPVRRRYDGLRSK